HAEAGGNSVALHDHVPERRETSGRQADLDAPVGGPCRGEPLESVTDDAGQFGILRDDRGTETRDPDAQLSHGTERPRRASIRGREKGAAEAMERERRSPGFASGPSGYRAACPDRAARPWSPCPGRALVRRAR